MAIHSRYDIEKPVAKRLIRRKLSIINQLKDENKALIEARRKQEEMLKRLSTEYVFMAKECEAEAMYEAAINNYNKALELYPENPIAVKRLKSTKKKINRK